MAGAQVFYILKTEPNAIMKMKTSKTFMLSCCVLLFSAIQISAQENDRKVVLKKDFEIQKHTIMERFETDFMISADERAELKKKRIADAEHTLSVLDTIPISNRKKKLLLRDLKYNPFSDRLNKFITETKFDDEALITKQK